MTRHIGADDLRALDPTIPRCCCCGDASDPGVLAPVHLRFTARFPFVWLQRGRAPRAWWRSCLATLRLDAADLDAGRHYLCPVCLPLARGVSTPTPAPRDVWGASPDAWAAPHIDGQRARARTPVPLALTHDTGRARAGDSAGDSVRQHILSLRQVFSRDAMVEGVAREGHRGIEFVRGSAPVRCRACGQEVARVADLAGSVPWDDPHYEHTPAGLDACPAARATAS